jgi:hypothetical protein
MTIPRAVHEPDLRIGVSKGVAQRVPAVNANRGFEPGLPTLPRYDSAASRKQHLPRRPVLNYDPAQVAAG